jgi:hypothetical protein
MQTDYRADENLEKAAAPVEYILKLPSKRSYWRKDKGADRSDKKTRKKT